MEIREGRSEHYVCSIDPQSLVDMEILNAIKRSVKAANAYIRWQPMNPDGEPGYRYVKDCKRVTVKGRDPKFLKNGRKYTWSGDIAAHGNKYDICRRLDIYVHNDRRWK